MARIFISYRREDSIGRTSRLYDHLTAHFGKDNVLMEPFMNIDTIDPGTDYIETLKEIVSKCDIVIVVIGHRWLNTIDASGQRRLDNPEDLIRIEITTALNHNIRVIPMLIEDARMPSAQELPQPLTTLARRQCLELRDVSWIYDVKRTIEAIEKVLPKTSPAQALQDTTTQKTPPTQKRGRGLIETVGKALQNANTPIPSQRQQSQQHQLRNSANEQLISGHIFISYSRKDENFVIPLATQLKEHHINVWLDRWNIRKGENYNRAIDRGIETCSQFLIVLSPKSITSPEVESEYLFALQTNKPVIPILYQDCRTPRRLIAIQHIDFRNRQPDDIESLEEILTTLRMHNEQT